MSGFNELTKENSFDYLITTDQYCGTAGVTDDNQIFVIFKVRDKNGELLLINSNDILQAFSKGYMKIINHIGSGEYSMSLTENNPDGCDFILKEAYNYPPSYHHVVHIIRGALPGHGAMSVAIKMDEKRYESTSFITPANGRIIKPSFAII